MKEIGQLSKAALSINATVSALTNLPPRDWNFSVRGFYDLPPSGHDRHKEMQGRKANVARMQLMRARKRSRRNHRIAVQLRRRRSCRASVGNLYGVLWNSDGTQFWNPETNQLYHMGGKS